MLTMATLSGASHVLTVQSSTLCSLVTDFSPNKNFHLFEFERSSSMNLQLPKVTKKFIYIRNTNILKEDVGNRGLSSKYYCIRIINLESANYFAVLSPCISYSDF